MVYHDSCGQREKSRDFVMKVSDVLLKKDRERVLE